MFWVDEYLVEHTLDVTTEGHDAFSETYEDAGETVVDIRALEQMTVQTIVFVEGAAIEDHSKLPFLLMVHPVVRYVVDHPDSLVSFFGGYWFCMTLREEVIHEAPVVFTELVVSQVSSSAETA